MHTYIQNYTEPHICVVCGMVKQHRGEMQGDGEKEVAIYKRELSENRPQTQTVRTLHACF